jgi:hypothetical protein
MFYVIVMNFEHIEWTFEFLVKHIRKYEEIKEFLDDVFAHEQIILLVDYLYHRRAIK